MNRIKNIIALFAFSLMVLALPSVASAQWRDRDRNDDRYGNGRYDNRYGRDIRHNINNIKNRAKTFEKQADRSGNRGRYGNNLEGLASDFRRAVNELGNDYGNGRNLNNSRDEARRVLDIASRIDSEMYRSGVDRNMQYEWQQIGNDLVIIADTYGWSYNNRGYRNDRNNRNRSGDWRNRLPFPF